MNQSYATIQSQKNINNEASRWCFSCKYVLLQRILAATGAVLMLVALMLTISYPRRLFTEPIDNACAEFRVDPALVRAVILCESGYRPSAVSSAGAVGLMQLMPQTARYCAANLGDTDYRENKLAEPAVNIRLGTYYLSYLLNKFDSEQDAIAAYNAGEGNVRIWNAQGLTQIPFPETREYVKRVTRAKRQYERILR